jgi:hypothetical protein
MIVGVLKEGLGNQLFQYFFIRSLNADNYAFDVSFFSRSFNRKLDLTSFRNLKLNFYNDTLKDPILIQDDFSGMTPEIENGKDYIFDGYWQHKNYLNRDLIIQETEDSEISDYILNNYKFLAQEECVSLHVRRGDFLSLQNSYTILDKNYYNKALDLFDKNIKIVVFSDDIEWCKSNLDYKNMVFINSSSILDLYSMSLCSGNIIANSTFSFWGAFLNKKNPKVVTPKRWFTEKYSLQISKNTNTDCAQNFLLDNWIKI